MKVTVRSAIFFTIALIFAERAIVDVQANTYFVATNGSDANRGTIAAPWATLRYAVSQLRAGNTLYIRGGIYTGANNIIDSQTFAVPSGTDFGSGAITISGYTGEKAILQAPNGREAIRLTSTAQHHLIFQDLILDGANQTSDEVHGGPSGALVYNGAHHIRFQRIEANNWLANGIHTSGDARITWSTFNEILNCSLHDNGLGIGTASAPYAPNQGYGAYIQSSDELWEGNRVYHNGGYGLHFSQVDPNYTAISRNVIRKNLVYNNGVVGGTNYGIEVNRGDRNLIYNNIIYGNRGGILVYSYSTRTGVYNNTIYNNRPYKGVRTEYSTTATIQNNIIYSNGNASASAIVDLNGNSTMSNNMTANPDFVNAAAGIFSLKSGSGAIDNGLTVREVSDDFIGVSRPTGARYDIGAYEYTANIASPQHPRIVTP